MKDVFIGCIYLIFAILVMIPNIVLDAILKIYNNSNF